MVFPFPRMKKTILSRSGGDRATAYAMSNKIVSLPDGYLCTWIDSRRLNRWALVDRADGAVLREGALGEPCLDNHCGAAPVPPVPATLSLVSQYKVAAWADVSCRAATAAVRTGRSTR